MKIVCNPDQVKNVLNKYNPIKEELESNIRRCNNLSDDVQTEWKDNEGTIYSFNLKQKISVVKATTTNMQEVLNDIVSNCIKIVEIDKDFSKQIEKLID